MNKFLLQDLLSGNTWSSENVSELKGIIRAKMEMGADIEDFKMYAAKDLTLIDLEDGEIIVGDYSTPL